MRVVLKLRLNRAILGYSFGNIFWESRPAVTLAIKAYVLAVLLEVPN